MRCLHDQETEGRERYKCHFCDRRVAKVAVGEHVEVSHNPHLPGHKHRRSHAICDCTGLTEALAARHIGDVEKQESSDDDAINCNVWTDVVKDLLGLGKE